MQRGRASLMAIVALAAAVLCCGQPLGVVAIAEADASSNFASHPPQRPLPQPSDRPLGTGPARFVHPLDGDDAGPGTAQRPWRTLSHAVAQLKPGETLYLRGGIYFEHVTVSLRGTHEQPITLRSYPGELAVLDGGLREFYEQPETAWEPYPEGAADEFRSTRTYPDAGWRQDATNVLGHFADSMVPLHGYRFISDLRSTNEYFAQADGEKTAQGSGIYCGPGLFYDHTSGRIHVRLAHTRQRALQHRNYQGETDPRKLRLIVALTQPGPVLALRGARYVRIQDLVVRGARTATIEVTDCANIELDGVTSYGGASAMQVRDTAGLRLVHCALRGIAAPWTFRGSLKYRAIEARIFSASGWEPTGADNRDFELAYSEFTDCVDGVFLGNVRRVRFHHNLLDNISDDGLFLTATTAYDGTTPGGDVHIYQNYLARCLTTFAFGVGHGRQRVLGEGRKQTGAGVYVYRNVFDFREPVMYHQPGPEEEQLPSFGRVAGDHGGPAWEPIFFYHNTVLCGDAPFRAYYAAGLASHVGGGTRRRVYNNIFVHVQGMPGNIFAEGDFDFQADGNLHWSLSDGAAQTTDFLARFRLSPAFAKSQSRYPPGWTAHDRFADPRFVHLVPRIEPSADGSARSGSACDLTLRHDSPAVDMGVTLPADWPDPLRTADRGRPDAGALPHGVEPWSVGVRSRWTASGAPGSELAALGSEPPRFLVSPSDLPVDRPAQRVAIVTGYPAFDAPLLAFAFRRQGVPVEVLETTWLDTARYADYATVAIVGDLARAKIEPRTYNSSDLANVRRFLEQGGTLLLLRGTAAVFGTPEGRATLAELVGTCPTQREPQYRVLQPAHPWVQHLASASAPPWLQARSAAPLPTSRGERILGTPEGYSLLHRVSVGKGQLIYIGWETAASLPSGRLPGTIEQEEQFDQQMQVLLRIAQSICGTPRP
jgi:hypothetical protein